MEKVDLREVTQQLALFSVGGERLSKKLRSYMEKRLKADLRDVFIHQGKQADMVTRAINARAFTYRSQIIFANGEYDPESREGMMLIAHELVHVLQQRDTPYKNESCLPIFNPSEPCEIEADSIALKITQGDRIHSIRPAPYPALCRAVVVDIASAKFSATKDDRAEANAYPGSSVLFLHCTANVNLEFADGHPNRRRVLGNMITFKGQVPVTIEAGSRLDEIELFSRWRFGFMQVSNTLVNESVYAGRNDGEGSIIFDIKRALVPNPVIDSDRVDLPFAALSNTVISPTTKPGVPKSRFMVTCESGDNPNDWLEYRFENARVPAENFLFSARRDEELLTVFTAIDPAGRFTFLASVPWHIIWHAELRWRTISGSPSPLVSMKDKRIDVGPVQVGITGAAPALSRVLTLPIGQTANEVDASVKERAFINGEFPLRRRFLVRLPTVPSTFFPP